MWPQCGPVWQRRAYVSNVLTVFPTKSGFRNLKTAGLGDTASITSSKNSSLTNRPFLEGVKAPSGVSGVRRSKHITPVLEDLHCLPVSQRVVLKTALMGWKCVCGVAPAYLRDICVLPSQVVSCDLQRLALYWFNAPGLQLDNEVSQSTDQPHGTVCHRHYCHWTCRTAPSSGHWWRTCSRPPGGRHWNVFMIPARNINIQTLHLYFSPVAQYLRPTKRRRDICTGSE